MVTTEKVGRIQVLPFSHIWIKSASASLADPLSQNRYGHVYTSLDNTSSTHRGLPSGLGVRSPKRPKTYAARATVYLMKNVNDIYSILHRRIAILLPSAVLLVPLYRDHH